MSGLSPHVRLVVSTLPDPANAEFQCLSQLRKGLGLADGASASSRIVEVETRGKCQHGHWFSLPPGVEPSQCRTCKR